VIKNWDRYSAVIPWYPSSVMETRHDDWLFSKTGFQRRE